MSIRPATAHPVAPLGMSAWRNTVSDDLQDHMQLSMQFCTCTKHGRWLHDGGPDVQALHEGLLPQSCAVQQGAALFQRLKQLWPAHVQPLMHARVLMLQARLSAPLGTQDDTISLVQQALALLADQQVISLFCSICSTKGILLA